MTTDTEARMRLLKIVYEFEAAGLSFTQVFEGRPKPPEIPAVSAPIRERGMGAQAREPDHPG